MAPAEGHGHADPIRVVHLAAPSCWWSWGYEAVFNRLPLVYGNQVDIRVLTYCVYDNFDKWLEHNGVTFDELGPWMSESAEIMGVPMITSYRKGMFPSTMFPASMAAMAANRQGGHKGARFLRALVRRCVVEGQNITDDAILQEAAAEASLDLLRFRADYADPEARRAEYEAQGKGLPHLPLGFFNLAVVHGHRTVLLDHAFEPSVVEDAIEWLSGGRLRKDPPTDIVAYLRAHGPAPLIELRRVFGLPEPALNERLSALRREGSVDSVMLSGGPHWQSKGA